MLEQHFITSEQYQKANRSRLGISKKMALQQSKYPAFVSLLRRHLKHYYNSKDLMNDGIKVFTTFNPRLQDKVQKQIQTSIKSLPRHNKLQGAMLITSRGAADILAVIGNKKASRNHFNRALDARRSIGSLIKPAIFLTALENGYARTSFIDDSPLSVKTVDDQHWSPRNFDKKSHGLVSLEQALSHSYNIASVRLGLDIGLDKVIRTVHKLGIEQELEKYPAVLLGAIPLAPIQIHQMYQTIADGGYYSPLKSIRAVMDKDNNIIQHNSINVEKRFNSESIDQLDIMLKKVVSIGTAKSLRKYVSSTKGIAAKTGTTNKNRDSWFVAYDENYVSTVWLGNDDNSATQVTGASGALKIWAEVSQVLSKN